MKRVMLLSTNLARGGAETQVAQLALSLRGWDPVVVSLLRPTAFEEQLAAAGIPVFSLGMRPGGPDPRSLLRLAGLLRRFRPHVLHAHMFHANVTGRLMRLFYPVPALISTVHSAAETKSGRPEWRDRLYRATDALSDLTVFVSEAAARRHVEARAVSPGRLRVIPNGVDTARFRPDQGRRALMRAALGLGDEFTWLAAGRLMWKKDYPAMLRAMANQRSGVLLMAGEGPLEGELRGLAASLGANVSFLGRRDDMPDLMNACDALASSSVVEGLPLALLEAAACGLPIVTTDAGGCREAVLDGRTGFVVPPGDADALAAAMARVTALTEDERRRMATAARELAVARFDLREVARAWEQTYDGLLENAFCEPVAQAWTAAPAARASTTAQSPSAGLDVTNRFVLDFAIQTGGRVLDFGCGGGRLVAAGLAAGLDIAGADVFYGGSKAREEAESAGLLGSAIHEIRDGRTDFPDETFDLVVNNQVLEHVDDLDCTLREIHRVLKPGGSVLSLFPSRDVFREGHIGIPFSHWFRKGSRARFLYTWALRRLGLGTWKEQAPTARQWAEDKLRWIDDYTRYRSRREIFRTFDRYFANELRESDYIRYRLLAGPRGRRWIAHLAATPLLAPAARALFRKLAFLVILSHKAGR